MKNFFLYSKFPLLVSVSFFILALISVPFFAASGFMPPGYSAFGSIFFCLVIVNIVLYVTFAKFKNKTQSRLSNFILSLYILNFSFSIVIFYTLVSVNSGISLMTYALPFLLAFTAIILFLTGLREVSALVLVASGVSWGFAALAFLDLPSVIMVNLSLLLPSLVTGYYVSTSKYKNLLIAGIVVSVASTIFLSLRFFVAALAYNMSSTASYLLVLAVLGVLLVLISTFVFKVNTKQVAPIRPLFILPVVLVASLSATSAAYAGSLPSTQIYADSQKVTTALNLSGAATMVSEEGAGPREEFRGFSFEMCDILNSRDCFITHYDEIALKKGVSAAVSDILSKVSNNSGRTFPSHCHQVVHNLGQMSLELTPDFEKAAGIDPQVCGTGFTHGLWELVFNRLTDEQLFAQVGSICEQFNMVTDWYRWSCHHILGHMIMTKLMDNPAFAMEYCLDIVGKNQTDCLAGGWMNYWQDDYVLDGLQAEGSVQDIFNVCYGAKSGPVKFFCYQELFPALYLLVDRSDYEAGKACLEHSEKTDTKTVAPGEDALDYADRCIQGLARAVAVSTSYDFRKIPDRCAAMPEDAQDACLKAAAASVVLNTGAASAGVAVCKNIKDDQDRGYCYAWAKNSNSILVDGPNSQNVPEFGDLRLPEGSTPVVSGS